jgi:hypothetical protein
VRLLGVGVVRRRPNKHPLDQHWIDFLGTNPISMLESEDIRTFRHDFLRLVTIDQFMAWLDEEDQQS